MHKETPGSRLNSIAGTTRRELTSLGLKRVGFSFSFSLSFQMLKFDSAINHRARPQQTTALCIIPLMAKRDKAFQQWAVVFVFVHH